jgi:hypothetical protein
MKTQRIRQIALLALVVLLFTPALLLAENATYNKRLIRQRAATGGDCQDRDHCIGVRGDKAYNYQVVGERDNNSAVERGNLSVNRDGLQVDESTREKYNLKQDDLKDVRGVQQYVETKEGINGKTGGSVGNIDVQNNRQLRDVDNSVEVKGDIQGASQVGTVQMKNSKAASVSSAVQVQGGVDARSGQKAQIGGVVLSKSAITDEIDTTTLIKGRK